MTAMGIGQLGSPATILKRKFRWLFSMETPLGLVPPWYCKIGARPQLDIEEVEVNFLNQATWYPGKARWQPLTISFIDTNREGPYGLQALWDLIASVYDFQNGVNYFQTEKQGWDSRGILSMLDGCGTFMETWTLGSLWPQSINWGDLDMASSEEATIDVTFRYSEVFHSSTCGPSPIGVCTGC